MRFDLLLKGGQVVDPDSGLSGRLDVAVQRRRIAAVEAEIPAESAFQVVDVTGCYVTPGLIDLHAHFQLGTYWGIDADAIGSQSGVTTWVDAGSPGALTLPAFRQTVVAMSEVRVFTFVNIAYIGLVAQDYELSNPEYANIELLERVVNLHRDIVVGIKVRAGRSGGGKDLEPLRQARRAADNLELPIMVHLSTAPPTLEQVLELLKPGDILTHAFTGQTMRLIDDQGRIREAAKRAIESGVIVDLGHGAGSFSFESAEALTRQGYWPGTISSDLHWLAIYGSNLIDPLKGSAFGDPTSATRSIIVNVRGDGQPVFNLLTCLDKLMYLGMPLQEAIRAVTSRPAEILGMKGELGSLKPGACADIAVLRLTPGNYELHDIHGNVRHSKEQLRHHMTVLDGQLWQPIPLPPPPPWVNFVDKTYDRA